MASLRPISIASSGIRTRGWLLMSNLDFMFRILWLRVIGWGRAGVYDLLL